MTRLPCSFRGNATRVSRLLRDQPLAGREVAVYWCEHVLRHGGAEHFELSSKRTPWFQYWLCDVVLFLAALAALAAALAFTACRRVVRFIANSKTAAKPQMKIKSR